jgi:Tol biopolymer transport system component
LSISVSGSERGQGKKEFLSPDDWDLPAGKIERVLQAAYPAFARAFSPDGKWLALALKDKQISLLSSVGQVDSPP